MYVDYLWHAGLLLSTHLLLLLLLRAPTIGGDVAAPQYWDTPYAPPYFDNSTRREVAVTVGQPALLNCRVRNLGDRAVSWIRKRDLHILTVGILTYTNDQRFQSLHSDGSDEWTLRITSPQARDSGTYECQVSTEPKISKGFRLHVVVSRAKIIGNSELFVKSGSDINLTCVTRQSPVPPSFIYWYKGNKVMNYSQREGTQVITESSTRTSRLLIQRASPHDSGNYTCSPSSSVSASVVVHVINGEHPAAMQHGNSSASSLSTSLHAGVFTFGRSPSWLTVASPLLTVALGHCCSSVSSCRRCRLPRTSCQLDAAAIIALLLLFVGCIKFVPQLSGYGTIAFLLVALLSWPLRKAEILRRRRRQQHRAKSQQRAFINR